MKAFFRKHRFKIVLTFLVIVFVYICFYMLWVHVPYTKHKNDLVSIQEEICSQYHYDYDDYFNAYQNKKINYILEIKNKVELVLKDLGLQKEIPSSFILADDELVRAYLRGIFMMCASINDPKTSRYHLEFNLPLEELANFVSELLNNYNLNSKVLHRDTRYMVYVKEAEKIGDFLRMIGAFKAVMYYEDIRIYRDHKNMTNRLNNCEQANVDRIIETSNGQVNDIELINSIGGLDLLDEKEKEVAIYRLKYRDASLLELSEIISLETGHKITKSGLYHRFHKIKQLADRIRTKEK